MKNKELANKKLEEKIQWYYQNVDMSNEHNKASLFMEAWAIAYEFLSEDEKKATMKKFMKVRSSK